MLCCRSFPGRRTRKNNLNIGRIRVRKLIPKWLQDGPKISPTGLPNGPNQTCPEMLPQRLPNGSPNGSRTHLGGLLALVALSVLLFCPPVALLETHSLHLGPIESALERLLGAPRRISRQFSTILGAKRLPKRSPGGFQIGFRRQLKLICQNHKTLRTSNKNPGLWGFPFWG